MLYILSKILTRCSFWHPHTPGRQNFCERTSLGYLSILKSWRGPAYVGAGNYSAINLWELRYFTTFQSSTQVLQLYIVSRIYINYEVLNSLHMYKHCFSTLFYRQNR